MELGPDVPAWLAWLVAGSTAAMAVACVARILEAVIDLDPS